MSEPLRTAPASRGSADADRDALIERLLLAGLDHYFEGRYEEAVNVWTRVAFLERGHGRARAYIERARGALAERQRQSDELLHSGLDAYRSGDLSRARELLTKSVADGGSETALLFLQRLGVAEAGHAASALPSADEAGTATAGRGPSEERRTNWAATIAVSVLIAGAILLAAQPIASWLGEQPVGNPAGSTPAADRLPVVRAAEIRLQHARGLHAGGRLREALRVLEGIDATDPLRVDADRLTASIQSEMLATVPTSPVTGGEAAR